MKIFRNNTLISVVAIAPLLMAAGCAGDGKNIVQAEAVVEQAHAENQANDTANEYAINNMDSYMEQLPEELVAEVVEPEEAQSEGVETKVVVSVYDELEEISLGSMTDEELLVAEILGEGPELVEEQALDEAKLVLPPPQQLVIEFAFDKSGLPENDRELIKQHAQYLLQHPNYVLLISGHADNRGSMLYNQKLSEQRAQSVADLLIETGVPASRLRVSGLGSSVPRVSPDNWQENRRVEFVYQDSMVANSQ